MTLTNGYITADEFRNYITPSGHDLVSDGSDDGVIEGIIDAVCRYIEGETRRTFYARTETHYYDLPLGRDLDIEDDDLLTLTTLTNGDGTVITSADYQLLPLNSSPKWCVRIKANSSKAWEVSTTTDNEGCISIVGTWGFAATAPTDVKQTVIEIAKSIYSRKHGDNAMSEAIVAPGGFVIEPRDVSEFARKTIQNYQRLA